jgi:type I restriction enzyme S subunit
MKLGNLKNPVMASWLREQGFRLDAPPFLSGAIEARKLLEQLPVRKEPLASLTTGHNGGIFNGPKFARTYVDDPEHGVPFVGSSDMLQADLSRLPLLRKTEAYSPALSYLRLEEGMTLISCSGTIGRMVYVRSDMAGMWSSQHIMKVVPNPDRILPGYLYAFLSSKFGVPLVVGGTYGAIIQHIEPHHIATLPVPRLGEEIEARVHRLIQEAAELRSRFQTALELATCEFFEAAGLPELYQIRWHSQPRDLGFVVHGLNTTALRALNFAPRFTNILKKLQSVPYKTLGELCGNGQLSSGVRFKRIDCDPEHGVKLIGQRQAFWLRPEGRWISPRYTPPGVLVTDETIMVAAQGTLGENEVFCQPILVTGRWLDFAYTQHFLRILSGESTFPGAFLFAFLRSEAVFRCFRSMSIGSKQQDLHPALIARFPVPICSPDKRECIAERVRHAFRTRDEADSKEDQALTLLESAIEEAP